MPPTGPASSAGFMLGLNTNVPQQLKAMGAEYQKMVNSVIRLNKRLTRSFAQTATAMTTGAAAFTGGPTGPAAGSNSRPRYGASSPYFAGAMGMRGRSQADAMAQIFGTIAAGAQRRIMGPGGGITNQSEINRLSKAFTARNPWTLGLTQGRGGKALRQMTKAMQSIESGKLTAAQGADTVSGMLVTLLNVPSKKAKQIKDEISKGLIPALDKLTKSAKNTTKAVGGASGNDDKKSLSDTMKDFKKAVGYSFLAEAVPAMVRLISRGVNEGAFLSIQQRLGSQSAKGIFEDQVSFTGSTEGRFNVTDMQSVIAGLGGRGLNSGQFGGVSPEVAATAASLKVFGYSIEDVVSQIDPLIKKYQLNNKQIDRTTKELALMGRVSGLTGAAIASIVSNVGSITRSRGMFGDKATSAAKQATSLQAMFTNAGIDVDASQMIGALSDPMGGLGSMAKLSALMGAGGVSMSVRDIEGALNSGNYSAIGANLVTALGNLGGRYDLISATGRAAFGTYAEGLLAGTGISPTDAAQIANSAGRMKQYGRGATEAATGSFGVLQADANPRMVAEANRGINAINANTPGMSTMLSEGVAGMATNVAGIAADVAKIAAGVVAPIGAIATFIGAGTAGGAAGGALSAAGAGAGAAAAGLAGVLAAGLVAGLSIWWASGQVQKFFKGDFDNASAELPWYTQAWLDYTPAGLVAKKFMPSVSPGSYQQYPADTLTPEQQQAKFRAQSRLMIKDPGLNISQADLQSASVSSGRGPATDNEAVVNLLSLIYHAMQNNRPVAVPHIAG